MSWSGPSLWYVFLVLPQSGFPHVLSPWLQLTRVSQASIAVLYVIISYILYYDSLLPLLIAVGCDFAMLIAFIVVAVTSGKDLNTLECSALPPPPSKQSSEPATFTVSVPPSEQSSNVNTNTNSSPSPSAITDGSADGASGYGTSSYGTSSTGGGSGDGGGNYGSSVVYNISRVVARAMATRGDGKKPTVDYLSFVGRDQPHCYEIKTVWGLGIALCVLFAFSSIVCAGLWRRIKGPGSSSAPKDVEG